MDVYDKYEEYMQCRGSYRVMFFLENSTIVEQYFFYCLLAPTYFLFYGAAHESSFTEHPCKIQNTIDCIGHTHFFKLIFIVF